MHEETRRVKNLPYLGEGPFVLIFSSYEFDFLASFNRFHFPFYSVMEKMYNKNMMDKGDEYHRTERQEEY